jgi:predicted lipoprotein with Yx(FWY)xxD motif
VVTETCALQEVPVKNPLVFGCAAAAVALAAGCGSSGKSTSATTAAPASNAPGTTPAAGKSAYGAGGTSGAASATTANVVAVSSKPAKMGTILAAGPKHLTVYLFEADKGGQSACSGACAAAWPPVTTGGQPQGSGSVSAAKLGTITRPDGTKQVTYNGHPLYFFEKDGDDGDAYGQGVKAFGAGWYVVAPSGKKIDNDEGSGGGSSAS